MSNQHQIMNRQGLASALTAAVGLRIALALLVGVTSLASCATTTSEDLGTSEAELKWPPNCCEGGTYICPGVDHDCDWVPGPCSGLTKPLAQAQCEAAASTATATPDSGSRSPATLSARSRSAASHE